MVESFETDLLSAVNNSPYVSLDIDDKLPFLHHSVERPLPGADGEAACVFVPTEPDCAVCSVLIVVVRSFVFIESEACICSRIDVDDDRSVGFVCNVLPVRSCRDDRASLDISRNPLDVNGS